MLCKLCSFVLLSHYYLLSSAQLDSTWFCLFSITIEFHLNVCGVVIATQPKVPWCFFVFFNATQTQHDNGGRRGDGIPSLWSMADCQTRGPLFWILCSCFTCCQVSKMAALLFVRESLLWLIKYQSVGCSLLISYFQIDSACLEPQLSQC